MEILNKIDLFQKEVNALRPFEGEMLEQIKEYYRIGLTWTSNALEGNSLTESETKVLLEDGLTIGGKPLRDVYEAVDHAKAYDFMFTLMKSRRIDEPSILRLHELFYQNIEPAYAGRYRDIKVIITGSHYPVTAPEKIQKEMDKLCAWIQKERAGSAAVVIEHNGNIICRDVISDFYTTEFRMILTIMIKKMKELPEHSDILFLTNAAYIQNFDKIPTAKSANPDLIFQCIEAKKRHNTVSVMITPYHKSPLLIETHNMATAAMIKIRKEYHQNRQ